MRLNRGKLQIEVSDIVPLRNGTFGKHLILIWRQLNLEATEMTMNEKKTYILGMNKAHLVKELVVNGNFEVEAAVDYVYDKITLTTEEFRMKYFGF